MSKPGWLYPESQNLGAVFKVSKTGGLYPDSQNLDGCIQKQGDLYSECQNLEGCIQILKTWMAVSSVSTPGGLYPESQKSVGLNPGSQKPYMYPEPQKLEGSSQSNKNPESQRLEGCTQSHKKFDQRGDEFKACRNGQKNQIQHLHSTLYNKHRITVYFCTQDVKRCHYFLDATPCILLAFFVHAGLLKTYTKKCCVGFLLVSEIFENKEPQMSSDASETHERDCMGHQMD